MACVTCTVNGALEKPAWLRLRSLCNFPGLRPPLPMLSAEFDASDLALAGVSGMESGDFGPFSALRELLMGDGVCRKGFLGMLEMLPLGVCCIIGEVGEVGVWSLGGRGGGGGSR